MRFLLQQGYGMMGLAEEFVREHQGSGVILSPRSIEPGQLVPHSSSIRSLGGEVLFDPQFYDPRTEHQRIRAHDYWEDVNFQTGEFDAGAFAARAIEYQVETAKVTSVILPGRYSNAGDEDWRDLQAQLAETKSPSGLARYMTIAIGPDVVKNGSLFDAIIDEMLTYPVDGFYFLLCHPGEKFMTDDEIYLYAVLDGFLSLSRAKRRIILGYANQQSLVYAAAGIGAIASGHFRNVRQFRPGMFSNQDAGVQQRVTWYFDGQTLGEYRIPQLGLAYRRGMRGRFGPTCTFCDRLLSSTDPSNTPWGEPQAFRHYLWELERQWSVLGQTTRGTQRAGAVMKVVEDALRRASELSEEGFRGGERDFAGPVGDACLSALDAFRRDRSADLNRLGR